MKFVGEIYEGVGVCYKGNSFYFNVWKNDYVKLLFNIDVNEMDKDYKLFGGYDKFKLSNVFRDFFFFLGSFFL